MTADEKAHRTRVLSGIIGPYLIVAAITLFSRHDDLISLVPAFMHDAPLVLAAGAFTLMAGLTIIRVHHHWTDVNAIVVSLIGIVAALKGAGLMAVPTVGAQALAWAVRAPLLLPLVAIVLLAVGLWLTISGWLSRTS
jgi:uncharacterized membrane protein YesL